MLGLDCNKMYQSMFYNYWKGWNTENTENIVKLISSSAQNVTSVPGLRQTQI